MNRLIDYTFYFTTLKKLRVFKMRLSQTEQSKAKKLMNGKLKTTLEI